MIYTSIQYIDTSDTHQDISYIFQGLVISGAYETFTKAGFKPELVGWINGDTFENVSFISAGFYNKSAQELLDNHINHLPKKFTKEQIDYCISVIQAASKSKITVNSYSYLQEELGKLANREWNIKISHGDKRPSHQIITKNRCRNDFRDIVVATYANNLSNNEMLLMLRFRTILIDMINWVMSQVSGVYKVGSSDIARNNTANDLAFMSQYTVTRGTITLKQINQRLKDFIKNYDVNTAMPAINDHFATFSIEPSWRELPIDYYRDTNIITNNQQIAKQATKATIASLLSKIDFVVRDATLDDKNVIY